MALPRATREFAAAWVRADAELCERAGAAFATPGAWRQRIRATLAEILAYLASDPDRARLYVAEAVYAGEELSKRRQASMARLAAMIDTAREDPTATTHPPSIVADGIAGGIWHQVHRLVYNGRAAELPAELPQLMYLVVLPYMGTRAAAQELGRPAR